jgi:hypothetical protein
MGRRIGEAGVHLVDEIDRGGGLQAHVAHREGEGDRIAGCEVAAVVVADALFYQQFRHVLHGEDGGVVGGRRDRIVGGQLAGEGLVAHHRAGRRIGQHHPGQGQLHRGPGRHRRRIPGHHTVGDGGPGGGHQGQLAGHRIGHHHPHGQRIP